MSTYAEMDHAGWMQNSINAWRKMKGRGRLHPSTPETLNDFQRTVCNIVGIVGGGIYNAPINRTNIDWKYGGVGVAVTWNRELSTFDYQQLTMLVFLCHEARIRCSIEGVSNRYMRICFWQRKDSGGISNRHPNIEEAVKGFREWFTADNPINFDKRKSKP